jgi:hypothetical protein
VPLVVFSDCFSCGVYTDSDLCVRFITGVPHVGLSAELWRFDTSTRGWQRVDNTAANGAAPTGRASHVMTSVGLDLWLHGGSGETDSGEGDTCSARTVLLLLQLR